MDPSHSGASAATQYKESVLKAPAKPVYNWPRQQMTPGERAAWYSGRTGFGAAQNQAATLPFRSLFSRI